MAGQIVFQAGDTNTEGVMAREVQWVLHWVLVSLYSRLIQNPGTAANYNGKKKGFKKEKGVKAFLLKKEPV